MLTNERQPLTAGISKKLITIFVSHLDSFIMKTNLSAFTRFVKPALDSFFCRDSFIVRWDGKNCAIVSCQPGQFTG
jgi:hypothetical protein